MCYIRMYDLPTTRKVCGSSICIARCSICLKEFPTGCFGPKLDYSGYDDWVPHGIATHRTNARAHNSARTTTEWNGIERSHGSKYSELLNLPFFDIVQYHVVDFLQNICLGIAKHTLIHSKHGNILNSEEYQEKLVLVLHCSQQMSGSIGYWCTHCIIFVECCQITTICAGVCLLMPVASCACLLSQNHTHLVNFCKTLFKKTS